MAQKNSSIKLEPEPLGWKFWEKRRYIIVLLAFLGYFSSYSLRVNLSVAIVAMSSSDDDNSLNWTLQDRGVILSSFYWGYILTQFIGGIFAKRFGGNLILGIGIGVPAVLSLITPWVGKTVTAMVVIRILQGLFGGVTFPCIHDIWFYWAPIPERSRMTAIAYAGMFIGTVVTMPASAYLASSLGWESIFYVFGGLGVLWHIVWIIIVRSAPHKDRFISDAELKYIQSTVSVEKEGKTIIPWKSLITSKPVYGITIAQFALNWGYNTMLTQMPSFLADTLNYDLASSGFLSGAPYLTMAILVRKYYVCGSSVVQTLCMVAAGFFIDPVWSVVLIIVAVGVGGFTTSGYSTNPLDIAPDFASVILGFSNTFSCLTGIISPILTGVLVQNQTIDEWRIVLYIAGGIYIVGGVIYWFWCSGELQSWSQTKKDAAVEKGGE
ncbi:Sialin [Pseudolycoriella hygida]|uniref:Sialin n=1 Tax=Pseudolycoriella hygida TaxID=35572 RepID=A0A9Q0N9W0_9DIPT|nr:Sialin [Pseudolycoriella hygida]